MADEQQSTGGGNFWSNMPRGLKKYVFFCVIVASLMAYGNHRGIFPTYGIFSGENSMHSGYHHSSYYGGYGIHGK